MTILIYFLIAIAAATISWFIAKTFSQDKYNQLEKEFVAFKAATVAEHKMANEILSEKQTDIKNFKQIIDQKVLEISMLNDKYSTANADLRRSNQIINEKNKELEMTKLELKAEKEKYEKSNELLATATANNEALREKQAAQLKEMEELNKRFNTEFENIANKILETKTEKFTKLNSDNLKNILEPFEKNIEEFKKQVDEVYKSESKERFSLGEKVKELAELNKVISEEAHNLTKALKGEAKTQGDWGQMILESILERSGLVKGREYFMEYQLTDDNGNPLRSDAEGKKMRPDAVIKYPDNRHVIIDSKVSLNAFTRLLAATDAEVQKHELESHITAIKNHIISLSTKGYDDYNKALDFVMMFIPSEPAYIAALQGDAGLWEFAYDKRILLLNPTNLITSLKILVDLWKREQQNLNAQRIAERGAKLYDKFVGFIENLEEIGAHLDKASEKYGQAYKQLSTGNDNLVAQATKLKELGLKTKKQLTKGIVDNAVVNELLSPLDENKEIN